LPAEYFPARVTLIIPFAVRDVWKPLPFFCYIRTKLLILVYEFPCSYWHHSNPFSLLLLHTTNPLFKR
jgi:hypothetical protein